MTINLDTLRTTVENAGEAWADGEHVDIITPAVVLALIAEIESLRTRFKGMRAGRDSERSRADVNANALERMEQRALGAEANLEAALNVSRDRLSRLEQAEKNADTYQTLYEQRAESLEQAEQAVARVRELHSVIPVKVNFDEFTTDYCDFCGDQEYPCPTIRALDGDGSG